MPPLDDVGRVLGAGECHDEIRLIRPAGRPHAGERQEDGKPHQAGTSRHEPPASERPMGRHDGSSPGIEIFVRLGGSPRLTMGFDVGKDSLPESFRGDVRSHGASRRDLPCSAAARSSGATTCGLPYSSGAGEYPPEPTTMCPFESHAWDHSPQSPGIASNGVAFTPWGCPRGASGPCSPSLSSRPPGACWSSGRRGRCRTTSATSSSSSWAIISPPARHTEQGDDPGPPPLYLPRGSVRLILIAGCAAVALVLHQRGQLTTPRENPGVVTLLLVGGFLLGVVFNAASDALRERGHRPPGSPRYRALISVAAAAILVVLVRTAFPSSSPRSGSMRPSPMGPIGRYGPEHVLAAVVGFYFGSRS